MNDSTVAFGPFVLDRGDRTLTRRGVEVVLPERSLRLLETLVGAAGRTVSRDRLVEAGWQGAFVSDTSLTEAMSRLRAALGDEAREPTYIRTVHRRGYRFIAPVGGRASVEPAAAQVGAEIRTAGGASISASRIVGSIAASLALVAMLWVGAVVDGYQQSHGSAGFSAEPETRRTSPRYRLAEVTVDGTQLSSYGLPALPLNDLSIDRVGRRLAFSVTDGQGSDVWIFEPRKGALKRVASNGYFSDPVWTPDGRALAMAHNRNGSFDLVLQGAQRDRTAQVLLDAPLDQFPESWSKDGRSLVYSERHPETGFDLWLLRQLHDDSWVPTPLVRTPDHEAFGAISPDGRYVAFASKRDQRPEVFVIDLERDRTPIKVSHRGGVYPFWSSSGDHLHYVEGNAVWTAATDQIGGEGTRAQRTSTTVAGLWLAGSTSAADRFVVATLDS